MPGSRGRVRRRATLTVCPQVQWLRTQFPSLDIEVDGGVGPDTIHKCAEVRGGAARGERVREEPPSEALRSEGTVTATARRAVLAACGL